MIDARVVDKMLRYTPSLEPALSKKARGLWCPLVISLDYTEKPSEEPIVIMLFEDALTHKLGRANISAPPWKRKHLDYYVAAIHRWIELGAIVVPGYLLPSRLIVLPPSAGACPACASDMYSFEEAQIEKTGKMWRKYCHACHYHTDWN